MALLLKIIEDPIVNVVRYVQGRHLVRQGAMADRFEGLGEIQTPRGRIRYIKAFLWVGSGERQPLGQREL